MLNAFYNAHYTQNYVGIIGASLTGGSFMGIIANCRDEGIMQE